MAQPGGEQNIDSKIFLNIKLSAIAFNPKDLILSPEILKDYTINLQNYQPNEINAKYISRLQSHE